jgi:hypothetical protein
MWYCCGLSSEPPASDLMIIPTGEAGMVVSVTLVLLIYGVGAT